MQTRRLPSLLLLLGLCASISVHLHAGLFKLDFGTPANNGIPIGDIPQTPPPLEGWDIFESWYFDNFPGGDASWKLHDFSSDQDSDVVMRVTDNRILVDSLFPEDPSLAYAMGMVANHAGATGIDAIYDGIAVPSVVKDDYLYRFPDTGGTSMLYRFANLDPGKYNITVFEGRTSDPSQFGKIWVDDESGKGEPTEQNTGNFAAIDENGEPLPQGNPKTIEVQIRAGDYLWYAHLEDHVGGTSGMIIRRTDSPAPVAIFAASELNGKFSPVLDFQRNLDAKTLTVSLPENSMFFRIEGISGVVALEVEGGRLVFRLPE